jgi:hypothetical protein
LHAARDQSALIEQHAAAGATRSAETQHSMLHAMEPDRPICNSAGGPMASWRWRRGTWRTHQRKEHGVREHRAEAVLQRAARLSVSRTTAGTVSQCGTVSHAAGTASHGGTVAT